MAHAKLFTYFLRRKANLDEILITLNCSDTFFVMCSKVAMVREKSGKNEIFQGQGKDRELYFPSKKAS